MADTDAEAPLAAVRAALRQDPTSVEAGAALRAALGAAVAPDPVHRPLRDLLALLDGGARAPLQAPEGWQLPVLVPALREAMVIHPSEKEGRQHQLASLFGRAHHLLEGNDIAHAIARVTQLATPKANPRLWATNRACAAALKVAPPPVRLACGEEALFTALLDRQPFLCVHHSFAAEPPEGVLTAAELRFALARALEHICAGHTALLQISPERLERMALDELPFLVRTPLKMASRVIGWTRANEGMRLLGGKLPKGSRSGRLAGTIGDLLPDRDQETVLPEVLHDWVRGWIQGVEYSADRAGLLLSGSLGAACLMLLRLCPDLASHAVAIREQGLRWFFAELAAADRPAADRLRELLRFALSDEYLEFVTSPMEAAI